MKPGIVEHAFCKYHRLYPASILLQNALFLINLYCVSHFSYRGIWVISELCLKVLKNISSSLFDPIDDKDKGKEFSKKLDYKGATPEDALYCQVLESVVLSKLEVPKVCSF